MVLYTAVLYGAVLRGAGLGGATGGHVSVFLPRSIATHVPPLGPQPTLSPPSRGRILLVIPGGGGSRRGARRGSSNWSIGM